MKPILSKWPVCGRCCEVALFPWIGGAHHCVVAEPEEALDESLLDVAYPATDVPERTQLSRGGRSSWVSSDEHGLHYLMWRVVDNAVGEAAAGYATTVDVTLLHDGGVQVSDDGRGIEVAMHASGAPTVEVIMTAPHETSNAGSNTGAQYGDFGGSRAVGVSVVNALSTRLQVSVRRDGYEWFQQYDRGVPRTLERGESTTATGTTVRFWADPTIFETTSYDFATVARRLQQLAFLHKGLTVRLLDERPTDDETTGESARRRIFHYPAGLVDNVKHVNRTKTAIHASIIHFDGVAAGYRVEIAMQWNAGYSESVDTFVNAINTVQGGTHEDGFRSALTTTVNRCARDRGLITGNGPDLTGDDIREGLCAVIAMTIDEPRFTDQTNRKLRNAEVKSFVEKVCEAHLERWLEANPAEAKIIVNKAISSYEARIMPRRSHCRG